VSKIQMNNTCLVRRETSNLLSWQLISGPSLMLQMT
jgi:hypothetical protein